MARHGERRTLGRGLSSLLGDVQEATPERSAPNQRMAAGGTPNEIPIDLIHPNPDQPRRHFSQTELDELAVSLRERGVIQPVVLRPHPGKPGAYQIVAGERRWRAAQIAALHALPAVVRDLDDRAVLEIAIVENVQRQDLDPLEEAAGYRQLIDRFGYTQEALASVVGKSRSHLANTLRLVSLPESVQSHLRHGRLTAGHARALLGCEQAEAIAERVVNEGLTVRQVEAVVKALGKPGRARAPRQPSDGRDVDTRRLEGDLAAAIGMSVRIVDLGSGAGEVRIRYGDHEAFDRLCRKLAD